MVGFKPTAVFDVSQTEGEPLPELETEATAEGEGLVSAPTDAADDLGVTVEVVDASEWEHGDAKGICKHRRRDNDRPIVEAKARESQADLAVTLVHEYAHALLHDDINDSTERAKREAEAGAVGYIVGRYFGLDTSGSPFYLAAWQDDGSAVLQERLSRINSCAQEIIGVVVED